LKDIDLTSIFVNNLEENTSEEDIREYFKDCGIIEKVERIFFK
jgi:polyadenylate-binding protein 2